MAALSRESIPTEMAGFAIHASCWDYNNEGSLLLSPSSNVNHLFLLPLPPCPE